MLTHDAMAQGTHFAAGADLADVAWKLVATNLSDLAAMGATPVGALLGYTLGPDDERFLKGLREVLEAYDVPILGGDTFAAEGTRTFGMTLVGRATHTPVPARSGARPGDEIRLAGMVGAAMLGFEDPGGAHGPAFLRPVPLIDEGAAVVPFAHAIMDVSDGLLLDASRMALASGVTLDLETDRIAVADRSRLIDCLTWGDDYALLFTCEPETPACGGAVRIGTVGEKGNTPLLLDGARPPPGVRLGYSHG